MKKKLEQLYRRNKVLMQEYKEDPGIVATNTCVQT